MSELCVCVYCRDLVNVGKQTLSWGRGEKSKAFACRTLLSLSNAARSNKRMKDLSGLWTWPDCICVCLHVCINGIYALPRICFLIGSCAFALPEKSVLFDSWHSTKCSSFSPVDTTLKQIRLSNRPRVRVCVYMCVMCFKCIWLSAVVSQWIVGSKWPVAINLEIIWTEMCAKKNRVAYLSCMVWWCLLKLTLLLLIVRFWNFSM